MSTKYTTWTWFTSVSQIFSEFTLEGLVTSACKVQPFFPLEFKIVLRITRIEYSLILHVVKHLNLLFTYVHSFLYNIASAG